MATKRKKNAARVPAPLASGVPIPALRLTADQVIATRLALDLSRKKIASAEKALVTMRGSREVLLSNLRELQRKLADEAMAKPE